MNNRIKYQFNAQMWQHPSPNGWYFISVPSIIAEEIRSNCKWQEEGWGRLKVSAKINNSLWETAIWFDTKLKTYLLPIKASIRKNEGITITNELKVIIWI